MVEILETVTSLKMENVSGGFDCGLDNYGTMRDTLGHFNYQFSSGIYLVEGECATGGWALSTILSGKDKSFEGKIVLNDKEVTYDKLLQNSCYVGENVGLKKFGFVPMTVKEQIEYGINKGLSFSNDIEDIRQKFGLSSERFNRDFRHISGERWRASMAIGYALGKKVYCFPWVNSRFLFSHDSNLKLCLGSLILVGAIVIIPTTYADALDSIAEEYTVINLNIGKKGIE